jgi:hypothetical protein
VAEAAVPAHHNVSAMCETRPHCGGQQLVLRSHQVPTHSYLIQYTSCTQMQDIKHDIHHLAGLMGSFVRLSTALKESLCIICSVRLQGI